MISSEACSRQPALPSFTDHAFVLADGRTENRRIGYEPCLATGSDCGQLRRRHPHGDDCCGSVNLWTLCGYTARVPGCPEKAPAAKGPCDVQRWRLSHGQTLERRARAPTSRLIEVSVRRQSSSAVVVAVVLVVAVCFVVNKELLGRRPGRGFPTL